MEKSILDEYTSTEELSQLLKKMQTVKNVDSARFRSIHWVIRDLWLNNEIKLVSFCFGHQWYNVQTEEALREKRRWSTYENLATSTLILESNGTFTVKVRIEEGDMNGRYTGHKFTIQFTTPNPKILHIFEMSIHSAFTQAIDDFWEAEEELRMNNRKAAIRQELLSDD